MASPMKILYDQKEARCYRIIDLKQRWEEISQEVIDGIYHFRARNDSLYIGESVDVFCRLHEHIFSFDKAKSNIAAHIFNNSPESNNWKVYILPTEQHCPFIEAFFANYVTTPLKRETVEKLMIFKFHTLWNVDKNYVPSQLPKYIRPLPQIPVRSRISQEPIPITPKGTRNNDEESGMIPKKYSGKKKA